MKKLLCLILALVMLCGCVCAQADQLCYMPQMNMAVNLPDEYLALTMGTDEDVFAAYGMDKAAIVDFMVANDTYLIILPKDFTYEIDVVMAANTIDSFNAHTEKELLETLPEVTKALESMGVVFDRGEFYTNGRDHYLRLFYHVPGEVPTYAVQYYTVQHYQAINFRLFTYGVEATAEQLAAYETVMENVIFE